MEYPSFDLLWLPEPIETCLHEDAALHLHDAELTLIADARTPAYVVRLAHCSACEQWYGLLPILEELLADAELTAEAVDAFRVEDESASAGVYLGAQTVPWTTFGEQMASLQAAQDQPTPTVDEVAALDQSPITWEVAQAPAAWIEGETETPELSYVALVHGPNLVRSIDVQMGRAFEAKELAALVRRAAGVPQPPGQPGRARTVRIIDDSLAAPLRSALAPMNIGVEVDETPLAHEALTDMTSTLSGQAFGPPVFRDADDDTLDAFFETASRFYEAEPWTRTEGDRFLGVQVGDRPWFFVNVMGQLDEDPGLSVFDDWLPVCRFIHNQRASYFDDLFAFLFEEEDLTPEDLSPSGAFEAAGAMEGLTLHPLDELHPADAERLLRASIDPPVGTSYPSPKRYDAEHGPTAPHIDLDTYRRVMEALMTALERRRATPVTSIKTTLDVDGAEVSLRYPSEGTERPYDGPPAYRLLVHGDTEEMHEPSRLPPHTTLVIDAPATALFKDIAKAAKKTNERFYEFSLYENEIGLWDDRDSRRNPSPRVADLLDLDDLNVEIGGAAFALTVEGPLDDAPDEILITRE
jgi:hypothetical protein